MIEDDELVRRAACEVLEDQGCTAVEAASANQGIEILAARGDIAVAFIDTDLPGAPSGADLVRLLVRQAPWVSVVATSGFALSPEVGHRFLAKPYGAEEMVEMVLGAANDARARAQAASGK